MNHRHRHLAEPIWSDVFNIDVDVDVQVDDSLEPRHAGAHHRIDTIHAHDKPSFCWISFVVLQDQSSSN